MDAVMQQARATGQQITEAQVKAMLVERLGQAVQMADQDVRILARKYKFDQEAIETAMVELQHEPKVQAAIARLQSVIENSPLGETVEVPADLTADRTLEIMTLVLDGVSRAMEEALAEAKQAGMKNVNLEGHIKVNPIGAHRFRQQESLASMVRPSGVVIALGAVALAIVALSISKIFHNEGYKGEEEEGLVDEDASAEETQAPLLTSSVSKKQLVRYLNDVAETIEGIVAQLPDLANMVMEEARSIGQHIPEEQVKAILSQRLGEAVRMAEASKHALSEDAIKTAVHEMHTDPEVRRAIENFQRVIDNSPLGETVDVPPHVTADYTLTAMAAVLDGVGRAMEEALAEAKAAGMRDITTEAHMYVQKSTVYTLERHSKYRVTEPILNAAVAKYKDDATFQAKLQTLLEKHQANAWVCNGSK
ncbi:hypothetical protein DYB32_004855 [Aphanomyces invadans]|uniref:Uncharacterized protein n=1 Tax=Aphanomyces invadans TaxID=157072 RepID=A0A3R6Z498_9STRA|nr:hypothetical protein DYB32_004855 [Aphanomyces invadans]